MPVQLLITAHDQKRIDKHGFKVTITTDGQYVVRNPKMPRRKYEGGNLSMLLTAGEMDIEEKENENSRVPSGNKPSNQESATARNKPIPSQAAIPSTLTVATASAPEPVMPAETSRTETRKKRSVGKRDTTEWRTYAVGRMILENPEKTADEVFSMCKERGLATTDMTVKGLRRYFNLCIKILADMQEERSESGNVTKRPASVSSDDAV